MIVQEEIRDANIQDAIHCVKAELEEEVCEECRFHRLCHIWCKDVSRIKLEALEKQIPKKMLDSGERIPFSYYCPTCKTELSDDGCKYDGKCCFECGQRLESEEE